MSTFKRLPNGLLEGVDYKYHDDGRIDWRAMIKPEYLAVQSDKKEEVQTRYNKPIKALNLHDIEDYYLIILLGGIKDLLRVRGYRSVKQEVNSVTDNQVVCTCTIEFIPNIETGGEPVIFSDVASASVYSVSGVFQLHLAAIAANRAFVRCVRNALGIGIAGKDEFDSAANKLYLAKGGAPAAPSLAAEPPQNVGFEPTNILSNRCTELGITFDKLRERALSAKEGLVSDPTGWQSFASIAQLDAYTLLTKINGAQTTKIPVRAR